MTGRMDVVYSNRWMKVGRVGFMGTKFYAVQGPDVVAVLPLLGKDKVVLERQYRPAVRKYLYEIPAGHLKGGESPKLAGLRELREETGYIATVMRPMMDAYDSPGILTTKAHFYFATNLKLGPTKLGKHERVSVKVVTFKRALKMIETNEIEDSKAVAALLYYNAFVR